MARETVRDGQIPADDSENYVFLEDRVGRRIKRYISSGIAHEDFPHIHANLTNLHRLRVRPTDVLIAAYKSCGTHWVWEVVNMLLRGDSRYIDGSKGEHFLEMTLIDVIENSSSPRVLNTHLRPRQVIPELLGLGRKVIFVTRNPKDTLVSNYKHMTRSTRAKYEGSFADFFELMMTENTEYSMNTWIEYTKDWEAYLDSHPELNVLYLHYEDMKEDLPREVRSIADFLSLTTDDRLVREISEKCAFDKMKAGKTALQPSESHMYRTGETGAWKQHFTVAMSERYNRVYGQEMADSGIAARIRFSI